MFLDLLLNGFFIKDKNNPLCGVFTYNVNALSSSLKIACVIASNAQISNSDNVNYSTLQSTPNVHLQRQYLDQMMHCLTHDFALKGQYITRDDTSITISLEGLRQLFEQVTLKKENQKLIGLILQLFEYYSGKSIIMHQMLFNALEQKNEFVEYFEIRINDERFDGFCIVAQLNQCLRMLLFAAIKKYIKESIGQQIIITESVLPVSAKNPITKHYLIMAKSDFDCLRIKLFTEKRNTHLQSQLFMVPQQKQEEKNALHPIENSQSIDQFLDDVLNVKYDYKSAVQQLNQHIIAIESLPQMKKIELNKVKSIFLAIENLDDLCMLYNYMMHDDRKSKLDVRSNFAWIDFLFAVEYSDSFHNLLVVIRQHAFNKLLQQVKLSAGDVKSILAGNEIYINNAENVINLLSRYIKEDIFKKHHAKHKGHVSPTRTVEMIEKIIIAANKQIKIEDQKDKREQQMFEL